MSEDRQWMVTYTHSTWRGIVLAPTKAAALKRARELNPHHEPARFRVVGEVS